MRCSVEADNTLEAQEKEPGFCASCNVCLPRRWRFCLRYFPLLCFCGLGCLATRPTLVVPGFLFGADASRVGDTVTVLRIDRA